MRVIDMDVQTLNGFGEGYRELIRKFGRQINIKSKVLQTYRGMGKRVHQGIVTIDFT